MDKLETTQRWLTSIIVRPGRLSDKISAADRTYALNAKEMIRSSSHLSPETKISIYARGYVLRLMECLRADYPILHHLLGEELFNTFAEAYLVHIPSHSPSLFGLGTNFPAYLKASKPKQGEEEMFDLPVELAQLERTRTEVARIEGLENKKSALPEEGSLLYFLGRSSYKTSPCLRLLQLKFDLLPFIKAVERNKEAETPAKRTTLLAISRKNYSVGMQELELWQWHYLQALSTSDHENAITAAAQKSNIAEDTIMADLLIWLPVAISYGYIHS